MESLRILLNQLEIAQFMNTDYNKEFTKEFAVGETVRVKNPQRFIIRDGLQYQEQAIARNYTTVTCDQIFGVDFQVDSIEEALKMERWVRKPGSASISSLPWRKSQTKSTREQLFHLPKPQQHCRRAWNDPSGMTVFPASA